jgi:hypothetical protein
MKDVDVCAGRIRSLCACARARQGRKNHHGHTCGKSLAGREARSRHSRFLRWISVRQLIKRGGGIAPYRGATFDFSALDRPGDGTRGARGHRLPFTLAPIVKEKTDRFQCVTSIHTNPHQSTPIHNISRYRNGPANLFWRIPAILLPFKHAGIAWEVDPRLPLRRLLGGVATQPHRARIPSMVGRQCQGLTARASEGARPAIAEFG